MEIAMIHVRHLVCVGDQAVRGSRISPYGALAYEGILMFREATPRGESIRPGEELKYCSLPEASAL